MFAFFSLWKMNVALHENLVRYHPVWVEWFVWCCCQDAICFVPKEFRAVCMKGEEIEFGGIKETVGEWDIMLIQMQIVNSRATFLCCTWGDQLMTQMSKHLIVGFSWHNILLHFCIYICTPFCNIVWSSLLAHVTNSLLFISIPWLQNSHCLLSFRTAWDYLNWRESSRIRGMGQASGLPVADKTTQFQCWKRVQCSLCKKETSLCHLHSSHAIL